MDCHSLHSLQNILRRLIHSIAEHKSEALNTSNSHAKMLAWEPDRANQESDESASKFLYFE